MALSVQSEKIMNHSLITWDAFRELDELTNRLAGNLARSKRPDSDNSFFSASAWTPVVDIAEDEKEYLLKLELPGIDKKDVRVSVEKGVLHISGERHQEVDETKSKLHRVERSYGSFRRSFSVPENADSSKIAADYKNGVLTLHLPKAPETQPKQIEIKVS
jgi:HSP20 family protein